MDSNIQQSDQNADQLPQISSAPASSQVPGDGLAATVPQQPMPLVPQDDQTVQSMSPQHSDASLPVAADVDLIEKEWVNRAKSIVAKTRNDPHLQSKELSKFKADYIKSRFNKDVKVSES